MVLSFVSAPAAALRRSPDLRRAVRHRPRASRGGGPRAGPSRVRSDRRPDGLDPVRRHAVGPEDQAEAAADGPAIRRRHRQHVCRRDPLHAPGCATTATPTRSPRRRSAACTGRSSRPCRRPSSTAVPRWPTSSTAICSARSASSSACTTCTTARASLPPVPEHHRARQGQRAQQLLLSPLPDLRRIAGGAAGPPSGARRGCLGDHRTRGFTPLG